MVKKFNGNQISLYHFLDKTFFWPSKIELVFETNNKLFQQGLWGLSSGCLKREIEYDEDANVEIVSAFYGYSRCLGLGASLLAGL